MSFINKLFTKGNREVSLSKKQKVILEQWIKQGKPVPPPHAYKQQVIKEHLDKYGAHILVETGTYKGEMVEACKGYFKKVISIELNQKLYEAAKAKFEQDTHVVIYQGDSSDVLPRILAQVDEKCLFWLDGHYSCGNTSKGKLNTPIMQELATIFGHRVEGHVILIDDARCFVENDSQVEELKDYPTQEFLKNYVRQHNAALQFEVANDIIRITP